jgi:hypothetical protein
MTTTRTEITLPTHTGPHTCQTAGLSPEQIDTLTQIAAEPGIEFITPMDGRLSGAKRPQKWAILVSRNGKLTPIQIRPDGTRSR